jgi:hypothetical protein
MRSLLRSSFCTLAALRLAWLRVSASDDERISVRVFKRGPDNECERCDGALGASAKADHLKPLVIGALERPAHLVKEIGWIEREVMRQVGEAEAFEGLCGGSADFRVVYETFKL